jgi:hypothetical protein
MAFTWAMTTPARCTSFADRPCRRKLAPK